MPSGMNEKYVGEKEGKVVSPVRVGQTHQQSVAWHCYHDEDTRQK